MRFAAWSRGGGATRVLRYAPTDFGKGQTIIDSPKIAISTSTVRTNKEVSRLSLYILVIGTCSVLVALTSSRMSRSCTALCAPA